MKIKKKPYLLNWESTEMLLKNFFFPSVPHPVGALYRDLIYFSQDLLYITWSIKNMLLSAVFPCPVRLFAITTITVYVWFTGLFDVRRLRSLCNWPAAGRKLRSSILKFCYYVWCVDDVHLYTTIIVMLYSYLQTGLRRVSRNMLLLR